MPHFLSSHITLPPLPFESEGFCFAYEARQSRDARQSLLLVRYGGEEFFLRKNVREKNSIIKCEKSSKSQPTGVIKDALKILMRHQDSIISHNLNNNSPRQNLSSPFIKPMDFIARLPRERLEGAMIEVGFGSGRHLLHIAQSEPQRLCVGVEIHTPSIEQVARQIELLGLQNLFIIRGDARILLEILPPHIAHRIFVHFPIPWNKKPHRRVFSQSFLEQSLRVLDENGVLHLRSDDRVYVDDALQLVLGLGRASFEVEKNGRLAVVSKYEARWERWGKDIYDIYVRSTCAEGHSALRLKSAIGKARSVDEPCVLSPCSPCQSPDLSSQILECLAESSPKVSKEVSESSRSESRATSESTHSVIASEAKQSTEKDSEKMDCHAGKPARNDKKTESYPHASLESPADSESTPAVGHSSTAIESHSGDKPCLSPTLKALSGRGDCQGGRERLRNLSPSPLDEKNTKTNEVSKTLEAKNEDSQAIDSESEKQAESIRALDSEKQDSESVDCHEAAASRNDNTRTATESTPRTSPESQADSEKDSEFSTQSRLKNFSFDKILRKNLDNYTHFPYKKLARDWFLHIDNLYIAKGGERDVYVLSLCFGDFNQPQNKFLQIVFVRGEQGRARYIGGEPLPTRAALSAHRQLAWILTQE